MEAMLNFIPAPVAIILMLAGFIALAIGGIRLGYKATVKDLALELVEKAELSIMGSGQGAKKKKQVKTASWGTATKLMAIPMLPPHIRAMKKSRIASGSGSILLHKWSNGSENRADGTLGGQQCLQHRILRRSLQGEDCTGRPGGTGRPLPRYDPGTGGNVF